KTLLLHYFVSPFKSQEYYCFYHNSDLKYNEVYGFVSGIFNTPDSLYKNSVNLAKHLYEQSTHPKIKGGEFYTVYFKDCIIDGETVDAVGLFKSENKDTFLKVFPSGEGFEIESQQGININKLDKGCLIFNTEKENGYIVAVVDNTNKGAEAQYWIDDFLHVRQRKDEYHNTQNILSLCKNFVKNELPQHFEVSKADQVDLLNKSVKFFKENDNFSMANFANEVIEHPDIIESFNQYKSSFQQDYDIEIADNFTISESAVKKQVRSFKSIIKLDENFDIYIHGDRNLIEQGEDKKGKYYKVYYKEES
ncbi:MAG: nucleoid-associated protein, partial [Prevotella sp.]|nr:nucleoid-associated protein [Prevotella sp.]